jgi:protein-S-isoprenylcysteine O-methyltransferase Ste14
MSIISKTLVILQFSCLLFLLIQGKILAIGLLLVFQIFAIILGIWAIWVMKIGNFNIQPELKNNAVLVNSGPYKFIRNPMYSGLILFFGSGLATSFHILNFLVFLLMVLVLLLKINREEKYLALRFGDDYLAYKNRTHRLIPYLF